MIIIFKITNYYFTKVKDTSNNQTYHKEAYKIYKSTPHYLIFVDYICKSQK